MLVVLLVDILELDHFIDVVDDCDWRLWFGKEACMHTELLIGPSGVGEIFY
jgi:hypothetical protein